MCKDFRAKPSTHSRSLALSVHYCCSLLECAFRGKKAKDQEGAINRHRRFPAEPPAAGRTPPLVPPPFPPQLATRQSRLVRALPLLELALPPDPARQLHVLGLCFVVDCLIHVSGGVVVCVLVAGVVVWVGGGSAMGR